MKSIKNIIEEIKDLKSEEEIRNYCNDIEGYSEEYNNYTGHNDRKSIIGYLTENHEKYAFEYDIPDFCLVLQKETDEEPDEDGYIPDFFYIGINFQNKKIAKYRYSQWDDGDCSEIVESYENTLNF